ncbi:MAG: MATE family efflux transporter [Oscillospiraceae bacterium]
MKKNIYESHSLTKLIFIFGVPSTLSLMIEMLTGIVDTAFAGNLPHMGGTALSAMALISPLLGIFTALQTLFAMSTGIIIARYMNQPSRLESSYTTGVVMSSLVGLSTCAVCYFSLDGILSLLGASGEVFVLAKQYLKIQLFSNIFSGLGYTFTCCIRAFGFPKIEVAIISFSVVANILCNFVFSFVFSMGMKGLALGTLVSEVLCALLSAIFLMKKGLWVSKIPLPLNDFLKNVGELFKIGVSQTAIQVLGGFTGFAINSRLLSLGSMGHVAAWSVVQRIYTFVLMPIVGLTQGVQSVISYFSGKGEMEKIPKISKLTITLCTGYGFVALGFVLKFAKNIVLLFGGNPEITGVTNVILPIVFLGFPLIGILYTHMTLLQVTGHEVASVLLILSRQVFFLLPLIYLLPPLFDLMNFPLNGVMTLFFCMPVADFLSVIFSVGVSKFIDKG